MDKTNPEKLHFRDDESGLFAFLDLAESAIRHQSQHGLLSEKEIGSLRESAVSAGYFASVALHDLGIERIDYETDPASCAASGPVLCAAMLKGLTAIHDALNDAAKKLPACATESPSC